MNYIEEIKDLLTVFIERNKETRKQYESLNTNKYLYEELFNFLNSDYENMVENKIFISILLNTLYDDNMYAEFYKKLLNKDIELRNKEINKFIIEIKKDYNKLVKEVERLHSTIKNSQNIVSSANRVILCIRQNLPILYAKYDIEAVKSILDYFLTEGRITNKENLLYINEIEQYNRKIGTKDNNKERAYSEALYNEIPNILNAGYEYYQVPSLPQKRAKTLDKYIDNVFVVKDNDLNNSFDVEDIMSLIKEYRNYGLTNDEYEYIMVGILNRSIEDLYEHYQLILDKDIYQNRNQRLELINLYCDELKFYLTVRKYYDEVLEEFLQDEKVIEADLAEDIPDVRRVIYATSEVNPTKAKIISDMEDVPKEYYQDVYDLIMKFKKGNLAHGECKSLTNNNSKISSCRELKDDQIRIIFRHIQDNVYAIMGVSTKKDDNDVKMYRNMSRRKPPVIKNDTDLELQLALSEKIDEELEELVSTKARRGNR